MTFPPDFFIVGAPKCGTTSLYGYLQQHPDVFFPQVKEPHYFARGVYDKALANQEEYRALFASATANQICGEASTWYLYISEAADRIYDECGLVKIIIMLRHPADMMYSLHGHNLFKGHENLLQFPDAISAEHERKLQSNHQELAFPDRLFYRDAASYARKVQYYLDVFGQDNVHIILFDDFKNDVGAIYADVLDFLGLASFEPDTSPLNVNRQVSSYKLKHVLDAPPPQARAIVRRFLPLGVRNSLGKLLKTWNTQTGKRSPLDAHFRRQLIQEMLPEIEQLEIVLDRDLTSWKS